ncbi:MAG: tripartite tricarboxylate transporter substrate binding protein [Comamonadaceae bacterium]|nr:MAG: tripartite tricarboxylate transporter substrate binding protein [Comamonadaceae bacterium]
MIFHASRAPRRALLGLAVCAALGLAGGSRPAAAAFPDKPIRIIVPFAAGGPSDVLARSLAQKLGAATGQPVIAENKPGAGTNLAADYVAKATPDGYTLLLMMVGTQAINEAMYPKLSYSTVRDFAPVTLVAASSLTLVAHPSVPAKNVSELIALAKAQPDKYNFASSGSGTPLHLGGELLNNRAGIKLVHVPYKGAAPALNDVLGGQVQLAMVGTPSALQYIKSGKLTAIGLTSAKRTALAPDVPTLAETLPGYEVELVYAIVAPAGTPRPVVDRLNTEINKAMNETEMRERMLATGFEVRSSSPDELATYIRDEITKWAPIVKASGAKPE